MGANSFLSRVKNMTSRVVDSFIPIANDEEFEEEEQEQRAQHAAAQTQHTVAAERRVANGGTVSFPSAAYGSSASARTPSTGDGGTPLTVHTTKVSVL